MESNKIIYILFAITLIWLLFLTGRGTGYSAVSNGNAGAFLFNNTTGEVWSLYDDRKRKVKDN